MLDVCYMLKLVRNTFGRRDIIDGRNWVMKWKFIDHLHKLQWKSLRLGNRPKAEHMHWKKNIMKVRLAAQVVSSSVADSVKFCQSQKPTVSGDSETVRSLSLHPMLWIGCRQNWNPCGRRQQHSSVIWFLKTFLFNSAHSSQSPTDCRMRHRTNCRRRTTNAAVIVTVTETVSHVLVQFVIKLDSVGSCKQFRLQWLSEQRQRCWRTDWTASGKLFPTVVATAEKPLPPMVAREVREIAKTVDDEKRSRWRVWTSEVIR